MFCDAVKGYVASVIIVNRAINMSLFFTQNENDFTERF